MGHNNIEYPRKRYVQKLSERRNNGLIKIDKDATIQRIDPVDAVLCAYKLAMYHDFGDDYNAYLESFIEDLSNGNI